MNELLKQFKEKVLSTNESFTLKINHSGYRDSCRYYHFVQSIVNNVKLIYGSNKYGDEYSYMEYGFEFELCAIVKENTIYIKDEFLFNVYNYKYAEDKSKLQELKNEQINLFSLYKESVYKQIKDTTFKEFYDRLNVSDKVDGILFDNNKLNNYKRNAISIILSDKEIEEFRLNYQILNNDYTYIKHLCDVENIFNVAMEVFNKEHNKNIIFNNKIMREVIKHIIDNKEKYFTENELNLIKVIKQLKEINCKNVVAEFEFDEKKDSAKISLDKIEQVLIRDDYFSKWLFITSKEGERIHKRLGLNYSNENQFKCDKITRIIYRSKNVYIRKDKED